MSHVATFRDTCLAKFYNRQGLVSFHGFAQRTCFRSKQSSQEDRQYHKHRHRGIYTAELVTILYNQK